MTASEEALFSIDVDAEIDKLCDRQFAGPVEILAEVLRTLIRFGAPAIAVTVGRRGVEIEAPAGALPGELPELLAALSNPQLAPGARHAALMRCEERFGLPVLALVATPGLRLTSAGRRLTVAPGRVAWEVAAQGAGVRLALRLPINRSHRRRLAALCRWATLAITVDGRPVSGAALDDALLAGTFAAGGLRLRLAIPRAGNLCRTAYLRDQIVTQERTSRSPSGEIHVAVVESLGAAPGADLDSAAARGVLRRARATLYDALAAGWAELPPRAAEAARERLLAACEGRRDARRIAGVAMWPRLGGAAVTTAELTGRAALWAVAPGQSGAPFAADPAEIFLLDARGRAFVVDLLGVEVSEPPRHSRPSPWRAVARRLRQLARAWLAATGRIAARLRAPLPVQAAALGAEERLLVDLLGAELRAGHYLLPTLSWDASRRCTVAMVRGGQLPARLHRRAGSWWLALPRDAPLVRRAAAWCRRDPRNVYPAWAALMQGHDGYGARKKRFRA